VRGADGVHQFGIEDGLFPSVGGGLFEGGVAGLVPGRVKKRIAQDGDWRIS